MLAVSLVILDCNVKRNTQELMLDAFRNTNEDPYKYMPMWLVGLVFVSSVMSSSKRFTLDIKTLF